MYTDDVVFDSIKEINRLRKEIFIIYLFICLNLFI